ncbi:POTRA domain-containing protein [Catalinimonas sp. 4WD22]|uniref:POTRA domain-containing protein n=1 Tax=Catalinimonas locisalis TaxID=3133978 RepID=UPI003101A5DB
MIPTLFQYLLEASFCLLTFSLLYKLFLARLTHFKWMRAYLLLSILLSSILPTIDTSVSPLLSVMSTSPDNPSFNGWTTYDWLNLNNYTKTTSENASASAMNWLLLSLFVYLGGIACKSWLLIEGLYKISKLIRCNPKVREEGFWIVHVPERLAAFSFLHYIFIGRGIASLHADEVEKIKAHEQVHIRQKHSLDLLLLELTYIIFWFNPAVKYLKESLQNVHEYLADEAVAGKGTKHKAYAHLLIKLACTERLIPLTTTFSNKQIKNRISMLMKTRTLAHKKLYFLLLLPLIASLMFLLSCIDEGQEDLQSVAQKSSSQPPSNENALENGKTIATIRWEGNTVYSDEKLNEVLGLKPGDFYNEELINSRLDYNPFNPENNVVSSLYMDNGYLFFSINVNENQIDPGVFSLTFNIDEGEKIKMRDVIIKGNNNVSKEDILKHISMKSGEWFDRSELIASQKAIAEMGYFDPKKVDIYPIPDLENGTVDIEFTLTEIQTKD